MACCLSSVHTLLTYIYFDISSETIKLWKMKLCMNDHYSVPKKIFWCFGFFFIFWSHVTDRRCYKKMHEAPLNENWEMKNMTPGFSVQSFTHRHSHLYMYIQCINPIKIDKWYLVEKSGLRWQKMITKYLHVEGQSLLHYPTVYDITSILC